MSDMKDINGFVRKGKRIHRRYVFWNFVITILKYSPTAIALRRMNKVMNDLYQYNSQLKQCCREQRRFVAAALSGKKRT